MRKLIPWLVVAGLAFVASVAFGDAANPSFTFSTDEPGATFTCQLDNGTAGACSSPKAYSNLSPGQHTETIVGTFTVPTPPPPSGVLLGDQTLETTVDNNIPGQAQAWPFTATSSGTGTSASFYVDSSSTATAGQVGVYADNAGAPGAKLGSASFTPARGAWNTISLSGVQITSGSQYWLAELGTSGTLAFRDRSANACSSNGSQATNLTALPAAWGARFVWPSCPASFYLSGTATPPPPPPPPSAGIHVVGNQLQNSSGQTTRLIGTDISGSSYACEQNGGFGFSDTPTGRALYDPMVSDNGGRLPKKWTLNSVVLGLNQDCWLGINGVPAQYSGQNYVNYVKGEVTAMEADGIYPVLTFFVGEPGSDTPNWNSTGNGNAPMPDNDHVPLFWEELASTFKSDPNVIFRVYEEPWPHNNGVDLQTWKCWSNGDVQYLPSGVNTPPTPPTPSSSTQNCSPLTTDAQGTAYRSVGMQSLVNIIRGTGATNVIQIPGVAFADAMSCTNSSSPVSCGFLDSADGVRVTDPLSPAQLMADVDNYPDAGQFVNSVSSVQATYGPVQQAMPFICGECGTVTTSFPLVKQFMAQYDTWGQSYDLSQWETWAGLISSYNGTPGQGWGTWAYDHVTGATL